MKQMTSSIRRKLFTNKNTSIFGDFLVQQEYADVTLISDDQISFQAHKCILSACSPFFKSLLLEFSNSSPLIYLRGIMAKELKAILHYCYNGKILIDEVEPFLESSIKLQVKVTASSIVKNEELTGENKKSDHVIDELKVVDESLIETTSILDDNQKQTIQHHKCNECEAIFKFRSGLLYHTRTKHEGLVYSCNKCDYKATQQSSLKIHKQSVHEGVTYPCEQCEFRAKRKGHLETHTQYAHEGVKYSCDHCDYLASRKESLQTHIQSIHRGIKYACNKCDFLATQQQHLKRHKQSEHDGVQYACNICGYSVARLANLREHKQTIHEGIKYTCNICDYQTNWKRQLSKHKKSKHACSIKSPNRV